MMSYLISKADFPAFVPLSLNVADALLEPYIRDAYAFDVEPLLLAEEWALLTFARDPLAAALADRPAIAALWEPVRALWVCQAFRLFLRWHGTHITPNGVENFADAGQLPVSTARRAELIADIDARAAAYRARLQAALAAYRGPLLACQAARRAVRPGRGGPKTYAI